MTEFRADPDRFAARFRAAEQRTEPYRHWLPRGLFPEPWVDAMGELPFAVPQWSGTDGTRAWNNGVREFFSPEIQAKYPVAAAVAAELQDPVVTRTIEDECGIDLTGKYLRIEYAQDTTGFWLEPHTDIGAKVFTMQIYLSRDAQAANWGTSVYDGEKRHVYNVPGDANRGLVFIPGSDSWHGYEERRIDGVRRSIIVNYVKEEWRNRQELSFPDRPINRA